MELCIHPDVDKIWHVLRNCTQSIDKCLKLQVFIPSSGSESNSSSGLADFFWTKTNKQVKLKPRLNYSILREASTLKYPISLVINDNLKKSILKEVLMSCNNFSHRPHPVFPNRSHLSCFTKLQHIRNLYFFNFESILCRWEILHLYF